MDKEFDEKAWKLDDETAAVLMRRFEAGPMQTEKQVHAADSQP